MFEWWRLDSWSSTRYCCMSPGCMWHDGFPGSYLHIRVYISSRMKHLLAALVLRSMYRNVHQDSDKCCRCVDSFCPHLQVACWPWKHLGLLVFHCPVAYMLHHWNVYAPCSLYHSPPPYLHRSSLEVSLSLLLCPTLCFLCCFCAQYGQCKVCVWDVPCW